MLLGDITSALASADADRVQYQSRLESFKVSNLHSPFYPHMPIGNVWIYRLLYVFFVRLFVCTVTDFSAEDEASCVKFCMAVHRRPTEGI